MIRGLRTLKARFDRITETTKKIVPFLKQHPLVETLLFPLDPDFPQFELATRQMTGACGLVTVVLRLQKMEQIVKFCESLRHILMAVSWGGHESLAIPKCASLSPHQFDPENREHRMVRLYFGLEDPQYLIDDLDQALNSVIS